MTTQRRAGIHSNPSRSEGTSRMSFVQRYLEPSDRLGEVLFGLIMVLTFTLGAELIVKEGRRATTEMLWGILGCNLAWGIIDGGMYVIGCLFDRSRKARLLEALQQSTNEADALAKVGHVLDPRLEPFTSLEERTNLYRTMLNRLRSVTIDRTPLKKEDLYGAIATFWLVFLSAIPAVLPFLLFHNRLLALRLSNGLLLAMLFLVGFRCGRVTHSSPWVFGSTVLLGGLGMVGIARALGG